MTAKYSKSHTITRVLRLTLILIFVAGTAQFLPGLITGQNHPVAAAADPVIAAAGDIACDPLNANYNNGNGTSANCRQLSTSNLLVNQGLAGILSLGDNQYYCGSLAAYQTAYDVSWGRVKSITHPSVGNHEYLTNGGTGTTGCDISNNNAAGYYSYFGSAAGNAGQGWYSFDIGSWHLIALNTNCSNAGGCGSGSPQYNFLQADLAAHPNQCILAFWHIPLFSSGGRAAQNSKSFWNLLYAAHADVVLNGHDHIYERFAYQNPSGVADPLGMREFIVGTGGSDHTSLTTTAANSEVRNASTYGVLKLTLHASSYDWQFVHESGKTFTDSGTNNCHSSGAATSTPTVTSTSTRTSTPTATGAFTNTFTPTGPTNTPTNTFTPTNTPLFTNTPTSTSTGGGTTTFLPSADAYVDSSNPTVNNGTGTTFRADASPDVHAYIKFVISGLSGTVTSASLSIHANSSDSQGIRAVSVADTTWGETTVNFNNAPPLGGVLTTSSPFVSGATVSLNLTGYITGNGTFTVGITNPSATAVSLASRESGANAPQLVITTSGGGSATPTNTPTFTSTATATLTPTPTFTFTATNTTLNTNTPTNTFTPTNTPLFTNTPTNTSTPTNTPLSTNTPTPTATSSGGQSFTFNPAADAYVDSSQPTVNFGTGTTLRVDGSPTVNAYLRFNVSGLVGTVTRVRLLIFANSSGSLGIKANSVSDNTWGETTINSGNAPALGSVLATSSAFTTGTWVTLDATGYITANGTFSFAITDPSATAISLASRESGANAPQLIVDTQ